MRRPTGTATAHHPLLGRYRRDEQFGKSAKLALLLIIGACSQMLFVKGANPFGIHYLQEVFLLFLLAYTGLYMLRSARAISALDGFLLAYVAIFVGLSTVFSHFEYGQPLFYGVFESRVSLMLLAYFPLKDLIANRRHRLIYTLDSVVYLVFAIGVLGILLKTGVFSVSEYYQLGTSDLSLRGDIESAEVLRGDRLSTGRFFVIFATLYALTMMIQKVDRFWLFATAFLLWHVVFVLQERQTMAGIVVALVFLVFSSFHVRGIRPGAMLVVLGGLGLAFLIFLRSDIFGAQAQLIERTLSTDIEVLARFETAFIILDHIHWMFGHGALSLLWQDGFHGVYSSRFFIGDVGVLGTLFRLGIIPGLALLLYAAWFLIRRTRRIPQSGARKLVWAMLIYLATTAITSAPFEYMGNYLVLMLVTIAVLSPRRVRNPRRRRAVVDRGFEPAVGKMSRS